MLVIVADEDVSAREAAWRSIERYGHRYAAAIVDLDRLAEYVATYTTLLGRAEAALRRAKSDGGNRVTFDE